MFSSKDIGNHGGGSVESEKELDNLLGALDNPNRMRILKFLSEGEKSRSILVIPTL
jgi:DNA-binding transcriptional ArsR family regulator